MVVINIIKNSPDGKESILFWSPCVQKPTVVYVSVSNKCFSKRAVLPTEVIRVFQIQAYYLALATKIPQVTFCLYNPLTLTSLPRTCLLELSMKRSTNIIHYVSPPMPFGLQLYKALRHSSPPILKQTAPVPLISRVKKGLSSIDRS